MKCKACGAYEYEEHGPDCPWTLLEEARADKDAVEKSWAETLDELSHALASLRRAEKGRDAARAELEASDEKRRLLHTDRADLRAALEAADQRASEAEETAADRILKLVKTDAALVDLKRRHAAFVEGLATWARNCETLPEPVPGYEIAERIRSEIARDKEGSDED